MFWIRNAAAAAAAFIVLGGPAQAQFFKQKPAPVPVAVDPPQPPPEPITQPTPDEIWNAWPALERSVGIEGTRRGFCQIGPKGEVSDCFKATDATFGAAASKLATRYRYDPKDAGRYVTLSVEFECLGRCTPYDVAVRGRLSVNPMWETAPTAEELAAAYRREGGTAASGRTTLLCFVSSSGETSACELSESAPGDPSLDRAALSLTSRFRRLADDKQGDQRVSIRIPVDISPPAPVLPASSLTEVTPTFRETLLAATALSNDTTLAETKLDCAVTPALLLGDCRVLSTTAVPGQGQESAAIRFTEYTRVSAWSREGQPVIGRRMERAESFDSDIARQGRMLATVAARQGKRPEDLTIEGGKYINKPTGKELSRFYPERALRMEKLGRASLRCKIREDTTLQECAVTQETPEGYAFGEAALKMAPTFSLTPMRIGGEYMPDFTVVVPVAFRLE